MISKILIIDDDEEDRELLQSAVTSLNAATECVEVSNGEDGLAYLTTCDHHPDYIFLDLNMPRISGLRILEMIKNHPSLKHIPVVIYSTSKANSDQLKAKQLGAIHFITKPYRLSELEAALRFVFEQHHCLASGQDPLSK